MQSTHWFTGENGHTYYFRVRALDWAGNQSAYTTNPFGNAFTSVLLTPAPVLDTSVKGVDSPFILWSPIGWSIDLWNTGNLSTTATITDTLPISLTVLTDTVHLNGSPMPDLLDNGTIRWTGNVAAGEHIDITFQVSVTSTLSPGDVLTNTVWIDDGTRAFERHAISVQPYRVFLPIGLR